MVRPDVVRRRLDKLDEYLRILERLRDTTARDEMLADPVRYGAAERYLQLAVEAVMDIGSQIIAEGGLGTVEQGRDIPGRFREHGYIDADMQDRWVKMIGFRNILVHDYLEVNKDIVYSVLQERLVDFRGMARVFAQFL